MDKFLHNRKPWQKGFIIGLVLLLVGLAYLIINIAVGYHGQCGGLLFSAARPCSFIEYMSQDVQLVLLISVIEFWWIFLGIILVSTLIGHILGKRSREGN